MQADEFNILFHNYFFEPLKEYDAEYIKRSRTIRITDHHCDLRLIRVGGRMMRQHYMGTQIVFRHRFLRSVTQDNLGEDQLDASDFPRQLAFNDFRGFLRSSPRYQSILGSRRQIHYFPYTNDSLERIQRDLIRLRKLFEKRVIPWAMSITPEGELENITRYGKNAWCEKIWIEDYRKHIKEKAELSPRLS